MKTLYFLPLLAACAETTPIDTGGLSIDLEEIVADPAAAGLVPLNDALVGSIAIEAATIRIWISPEAADAYAEIQPDDAGSGVSLPDGTVIVREVYDTTQALSKSTLLVRAGDPEDLGGWIFGVYDQDGVVSVDDDGRPLLGVLSDCAGCHTARQEDDYLFGLPR